MAYEKLKKPVVLYLASDGDKKRCGRCSMFLKDINRCSIHGEDVPIEKTMICGFYLYGKPMTSEDHPPMELVMPGESGLIDTNDNGTHCESCIHARKMATVCEIVEGEIEPDGCCNGWANEEIEIPYKKSIAKSNLKTVVMKGETR